MDYRNFSENDLEELDAKFDALCEHLGVEFVFTKISDGSDRADIEKIEVRPKYQIPAGTATMLTKRPRKGKGLTGY